MTETTELLEVPQGPAPLPLLGNYADLKEGFHIAMPQLIQKYGDSGLFTIQIPSGKTILPLSHFGGPTIAVANPTLLEEMYKRPEDFNKQLFKHSRLRKLNAPSLFISDDDEAEHDQAARVLLPAFSMDGMKQYYDIIQECTQILCTLFTESAGSAVDLHPILSTYTFEIIGRVGFGHTFNAITKPDECTFLRNFEASSVMQSRMKEMSFQMGQFVTALVSGDLREMKRLQQSNRKEVEAILAEKKKSLEQCPVTGETGMCPVRDMATRMLTVPDPDTNVLLPDSVVASNTMTFLVAGHDSTSTAITMLLYHVASHPEVEQKVFEEVSRVVGDQPLTWDMLGKLVYCTQVVKENLRLFPPAPHFVKNSPPDRETTLGKYRIPPGSSLLISTFALHYNPTVYEEPYAFKPERWEGEEAAKRSPYAWLPFSYGKRACIGMQLSLIEQRVSLVELVRKYFLRVDPSTKITITEPLFMNPQGIHLRFIPRSTSAPPPPPLTATCLTVDVTSSDLAPLGQFEQLCGKKLLVLYGSNMSTCEGFATHLVGRGSELGLSCTKVPLNALSSSTPPELPHRDQGLVLVVTSTYNGLPPDNAKSFADWLPTDGAAAALKNVAFSVFGAGNRQWAATYQRFGRSIDERLRALGAQCLADMGEGDMDGGQIEVEFMRWTLAWTVGLFQSERIPMPETLKESMYPRVDPYEVWLWHGRRVQDLSTSHRQSVMKRVTDGLPLFQAHHGWLARVAENRELVDVEGRSTRHLEITLPEGTTYVAGDHLGVVCSSPPEVVLGVLKRLGIAPDAVVKLEPGASGASDTTLLPLGTPVSAYVILAVFVELQDLATRTQLHWLSKKTTGASKLRLEALAAFEGDEYEKHVVAGRRTFLEILNEFPETEIQLGELVALLPPMKPRYYSISSSPKTLPNAVNITVSVVQGISPTGREHLGVCSNFLRAQPSSLPQVVDPTSSGRNMAFLALVKDTGSTFRLPVSLATPIIMVGPGTGLAPMRGFIQDRVADNCKENLLFFGCRDEGDFLYREELQAWESTGALELHVAFSRKVGCAKTYVQHLIEREASRVAELLQRGAHVYVCGDASRMAPDVRATFERVAAGAGLGDEYVEKMVDAGRYCQDVWASQSL